MSEWDKINSEIRELEKSKYMYSNVWGVVKCKKRVLTQYCAEVKSYKNTDNESTYVRIFHDLLFIDVVYIIKLGSPTHWMYENWN